MKLSFKTHFPAALLTMWTAAGVAHHSLAMFDMDKSMALEGTLKSVQWTNPHSWFVLDVAGADGMVKEWNIEGPSPNGLIRRGWKHGDVNVGDHVKLTFHPRKDGYLGGTLVGLRLPSGKDLRLMPDGPAPKLDP